MNLPRWINVALLGIVLLLLVTIFSRLRPDANDGDRLKSSRNSTLSAGEAIKPASRTGPLAEQTRNTASANRPQSTRRSASASASSKDNTRSDQPGPLERNPIGFSAYEGAPGSTEADPENSLGDYAGLGALRDGTSRITSG